MTVHGQCRGALLANEQLPRAMEHRQLCCSGVLVRIKSMLVRVTASEESPSIGGGVLLALDIGSPQRPATSDERYLQEPPISRGTSIHTAV